jgi:Malectin domain
LPLQTANANAPSITAAQSITADAASTQTQARASATVSSTVSSYTAINAGGAAAAGNWLKDSGHGGYSETVSDAINVSHVTNAAPQSVYQSQRTGTSSYSIGNLTANGTYFARLHFVESWWQSAGKRLFNVKLNGAQVLTNFDIFKAAGGHDVAVVESLPTKADSTGTIAIQFVSVVDLASVAGIEITNVSGAQPSPNPTATPGPTSTPTPAPKPTPAPVGNTGSWPSAGWVPYNGGPMTQVVSSNPSISSKSSSVVAALWRGRPNDAGEFEVDVNETSGNFRDFSLPLYFGHAGDPVYTINCYEHWGHCTAQGHQVHIPRGAMESGGSDHHIAIRDTTSGEDFTFWLAPTPNGNGGTYNIAWGGMESANSQGLNVNSTASGLSALWALRAADLEHNSINHALIITINRESPDGFVYPANGWDNSYFHSDPWPQMGAHLWLDAAPPYQSGCPQYAVSYLTALHKYGAFVSDQGGTAWVFSVYTDSDMGYTMNGGASAWAPLMQSIGKPTKGTANVVVNNCGIDMSQHMHILNPPSPS